MLVPLLLLESLLTAGFTERDLHRMVHMRDVDEELCLIG
jgi:hypothetical protein